jgi:hypothetical protein
MADVNSVVSFRISSSLVVFALHADDEGFTVVDKRLLCLRFHLQETSLLIEKEEFDSHGNLIRTVYQKPSITESGTYYRVTPGSYNIIGGVSSFNFSQASTLTPRSAGGFDRWASIRMRPTLSSMKESPEYIVLSSSDEEEVDLRSSSSMKSEDVSVNFSDDDSIETGIDLSPSGRPGQCFNITELESSHPGSFLVSDTPSRSLGCDTSDGSKPTSTEEAPPPDLTNSIDFSGSQKGDADVSESYDSSVYEYVVVFGNQPHSKSLLKSSNLGSFPHHRIKFLPS